MSIKKGDTVVQVQPEPIKGTVVGFSLDQEEGVVMVKVQYTDAEGDVHERDFKQDEVTVETPEEEAPAEGS